MKNFLLSAFFLFFSFNIMSQEAIWDSPDLKSPEINADNSVIFRLYAPNATDVKITGNWMEAEGWSPGTVDLTKDDKGIWIYESDPLNSDLYSYSFLVDGVRVNDPSNVFVVRDVNTLSNIFIIEGKLGDLYSVNDVPQGTVTYRWYFSKGNDKDRRITVYTPPNYEQSNKSYPVLYLLHGMGGDEEAWSSLGRAAQILDNLISRGDAEPMIVVMPNGNVAQQAAPGKSQEGLVQPSMSLPNTMDGKREKTFIDVIEFIEENYRVKQSASKRAIAGLSMGGFHSLHISRIYPKTFDYVGLFSAAVFPDESVDSEVYNNFEGALMQQMENGYELYYIAMGKEDFLYDQCVELRSIMDSIGMSYIYNESDGGHTWSNWRVYLSEFVPMLFK
ncbi:alpha/beta hydrolase-fold protein [Marinilabiliaceae bacterium ANBcel2]|nr:alpha/beta hydrolase-fold protein [Marinilabiliaceae bacterium ANBcel2]